MVKIINKISKILVLIVFVVIIVITSIKVVNNHNDKLLEVSHKYIIEQAKKCIDEKKCLEEKITLQTLYDLDYLEKLANPVTKKYYNNESYVKKEENNYTFVEIT